MKKLKNIAIAIMLVICASVALVACGATSVVGKTYASDKVTSEFKTLTAAQLETLGGQEAYDAMKARVEKNDEIEEKTTIEFKEDDTMVVTTGKESQALTFYYTQDGKNIKLYTDKEKADEFKELGQFTVSGKTLKTTLTFNYSDTTEKEVAEADDFVVYTKTITFKQA